MRLLRAVFTLAIFAAALFLTSWAIRQRLSFPPVEGVEPKVEWLAASGDQYDTLFVGSSRTFWQMIPQEFDREMAAAGQPTHSFNLGFNSVRPPEDSYLLETVLRHRRAPLRYVLVEADEIALKIRPDMLGTNRLAYWHDLRRVRALAEQVFAARRGTKGPENEGQESFKEALFLFFAHLPATLARATNLGRAAELIASTASEKPPEWKDSLGKTRDGYTDRKEEVISDKGAKLLARELAERARFPVHSPLGSEATQRLFADMQRQVEALGGKLIVFVPPRTEAGRFLPDPQRFPHLPVLDFNDPARYPELYDTRYRRDTDHLNNAGAAIFTRLLTNRLLEAL